MLTKRVKYLCSCRRRKLADFISHPISYTVSTCEVDIMETKLSPKVFGQPEVSAQDILHPGIVNSEIGSDRFQFINARPIGGINGLVNHEDRVRGSLTGVGTEVGKRSGRGNLASIVEDDFYPEFL